MKTLGAWVLCPVCGTLHKVVESKGILGYWCSGVVSRLEDGDTIIYEENSKKRRGGVNWKAVMVVVSILTVIAATFYLLGKLVKGLTAGGVRNRDLYLPRVGRRYH